MKRLSDSQLGKASDILGSVAVAWFSAGVISPVFIRPANLFDFLFSFGISLLMSCLFFAVALLLVEEVKL